MKKIIPIIIIAVVVAAALMLFSKRKADLAKAPVAPVLPVVVESATLARQNIFLTLPAMGVVTSDLSTTLSTRISGQVLQVLKQEGDPVRKGETLARIEVADLTARLEGIRSRQQGLDFQIAAAEENGKAAATALAAARQTHERTLELLRIKGASIEESSREEAEIASLAAGLATARNAVDTLRKERESLAQNIKEIEAQASYATITAPISGTLSQRLIVPGDLATPGKPLFRIASGSELSLNLSLPSSIAGREIIIQDKTLPIVSKNEAATSGLVQYVTPAIGNLGFAEGQYVNVRVVVYRGENVLVPVDALLTDDSGAFVFIFQDGRAVKTRVEIVARGSEGVIVAQDLAGKEILLAKPDLLLRVAAGVPVLLGAEKGAGSAASQSTGGPTHD